jgi:hypothetical protein
MKRDGARGVSKPDKLNELSGLGKFGTALFDIGWKLAAVVIGFLLLGKWLDEKFNTYPLFILLSLGLIVVCFALILRSTLKHIPRSLGGLKDD